MLLLITCRACSYAFSKELKQESMQQTIVPVAARCGYGNATSLLQIAPQDEAAWPSATTLIGLDAI